MKLFPVCLFTYNRLKLTQQTIEALKKNELSNQTELFIFSDGYKKKEDESAVNEVRAYLKTITGFDKIHILERESNLGLARSVIGGVTEVIDQRGAVIVLEDDIYTASNFLQYMNQALHFYKNYPEVFSVTAYNPPVIIPKDYNYDSYFSKRFSSWGWGSWKEKWDLVDWEVKDYLHFENNKKMHREFNQGGQDLSRMLARQMAGKMNSWAIRCCYHQFKNKLSTVYAVDSKVMNIGFGEESTHTRANSDYAGELDTTQKKIFRFADDAKGDQRLFKAFKEAYSLRRRFVGRIKHYLSLTKKFKNQA